MGCFNITGFQTQIPIRRGDEIFVIIGVYNKNFSKYKQFSTGYTFTPIYLPIFGTYNDYGCIEDVKKDQNVMLFEKITSKTTEEVIEILDNYAVGRYKCEQPYKDLIGKLKKYFGLNTLFKEDLEEGDTVTFIMDHKFLYEECIKSMSKNYRREDFENDVITTKKISAFSYILSDENYFYNLNPNIRFGYLYGNTEMNSMMFLTLYRKENSVILLNELKDNYYNFLCFFKYFKFHSWIFDIHNYCQQIDHTSSLLSLYERMVDFINKRKNETD